MLKLMPMGKQKINYETIGNTLLPLSVFLLLSASFCTFTLKTSRSERVKEGGIERERETDKHRDTETCIGKLIGRDGKR